MTLRAYAPLVYLLAISGCVGKTVWYGYSPDRRHRAEVWTLDNEQYIALNGRHSGPHSAIGTSSAVFSPDSQRLAYVARVDDQWVLVIDGMETEPWDGIAEVRFSPDSRRLAFAGERDGRWHVVLDGEVGPALDGLLRDTLQFSPDSQRLAYVAERYGTIHVVSDGSFSAAYDGIGRLQFSPDSRRLAFLVRAGGSAHAVVDGVIGSGYERITEFKFGPDSVAGYLARTPTGQRAVIGGHPGPLYRAIVGLLPNPRGHSWSYIARVGHGWSVVRAGTPGPSYDQIDPHSLRYSGDGARLAYVAARGSRWYMVLDGHELGPHDAAEPMEFARRGSAWGYIAHTGAQSQVVRGGVRPDGKRVDRVPWAGNLRFTARGDRYGYLAQRLERGETRRSVIVDDRPFDFELLVDGSLIFSRDGRHWACLALVDRSGQFWLIVDGEKRAPFDLVEVMYLMADDPYGAMLDRGTEARVTDIVAAELERTVSDRRSRQSSSSDRIPTIAFARNQPTPATARLPSPGALGIGAALSFITAASGPDADAVRLTDSVLARTQARYSISARTELSAGVTVLAKQAPGSEHGVLQRAYLGTAWALASGRSERVGTDGLSLGASVAGERLLQNSGWSINAHIDMDWRRRLSSQFVAQTGLTLDGRMLTFSRAADRRFASVAVSVYSRGLWHRARSRVAAWAGADYQLPLAHTSGVPSPLSDAMLVPSRRARFDIGAALAIANQWNLFVRLEIINRSDSAVLDAAVPVLDGGSDQRQLTFGIIRRYGTGPLSPALAGP